MVLSLPDPYCKLCNATDKLASVQSVGTPYPNQTIYCSENMSLSLFVCYVREKETSADSVWT